MNIKNQTQLSQNNQISIQIIDASNKHKIPYYNLQNLPKTIPTLTSDQHFTDYKFKLPTHKNPSIKIKRLSQIYPPMTNLFLDLKTGRQLNQPTKNKINTIIPTYLSQLNMLPFTHFCKLIQPAFINQLGYYHVVVQREGILVKQIIDDKFYYDQKYQEIVTHPEIQDYPWVHILIKVWAKINKGYEYLNQCQSFSLIKTFSFPDWQIINPNKQKIQKLISKLAKATSQKQLLITKTKDNKNVGFFGFWDKCSSYVIKKHHQEYGNIFIILESFVLGGWNRLTSKSAQIPEDMPHLKANQFLMPLPEFLNNFHLIYCTSNKYFRSDQHYYSNHQEYQIVKQVNYQKYILNIDAMETNSHVLAFDLQSNMQSLKNIQVGLSFYFPSVNMGDLIRQQSIKTQQKKRIVVPRSKIMIGKVEDCASHIDPSFVESVKQKIMYCEQQDHMSFTIQIRQHDYIIGDYFKGFANQFTHILCLCPGKYLIRFKMQQKKLEYRCYLSATAINGTIKFYDPKLTNHEQRVLLKDCLFKKAVNQKICITFINPTKRGSWISCRDQYQIIGYSYIAVYVIKNNDNKILIKIQPKKVKQNGYIIKRHKDMKDFEILLDSEQSTLIILKPDKQWGSINKKIWPPPGIQFCKIPKIIQSVPVIQSPNTKT